MKRKREPLGADCIQFCERWAAVWRALAVYARERGYWEQAERMTTAADDIYERLEILA